MSLIYGVSEYLTCFINLNFDLTYITKFKAYYICMWMALRNVGHKNTCYCLIQRMLSNKLPRQWGLLTRSLTPPLANWTCEGKQYG